MVFIGEGVEVFLFLLDHILHTLVDRCAAVSNLLQDGLKDDDVTNHSLLQHIDLHHTEQLYAIIKLKDWRLMQINLRSYTFQLGLSRK